MWDFVRRAFDPTGFPARWQCGEWTPAHGWLHIASDVGIWSAYFLIPCVLGYYFLRRREFPFRGVLFLFVVFILACGLTHLLEAAIFWWPAYRLAGLLKLFTAVVSWTTVLALLRVTPRVMALRAPAELEAERQRAEAALRVSEERFRLLVEGVEDYAIFMLDPAGNVASWNSGAERITGYRANEILGRNFSLFYPAEDVARGHPDEELRAALADGRYAEEGRRVRKDGAVFWANVTITPLRDHAGRHVGFAKVTRDVTERRLANAKLLGSEEQYRALLDDQTEVVSRFRADGTFTFVNQVYCRTFGKSADELLGTKWHPVAHPDDVPLIEAALARLSADVPVVQIENRVFDAAGRVRWMEFVNRGFFDPAGRMTELQSVGRDVTDRRAAEEKVGASLREKEVLLKEIHHRVKNNLQIVSALLDLQAVHTDDPAAREMFRESRGRVRSMALIHERLYRSSDLARVDFGEYARQLAADLFRAYTVSAAGIELVVDAGESNLPLDTAIPCGLLLNELVSNCLKHAFPSGRGGRIRITLTCDDAGTTVLGVADDGVGLPAGLDFRTTKSFGLQLVNTLVEQLNGTAELRTSAGVEFVVTFASPRQPDSR